MLQFDKVVHELALQLGNAFFLRLFFVITAFVINAIFLIVLGFDDLQTFEKYGGTVTCLPECEHFNYHFEVALGSLAKTIALNGHPFLLVFQ